MDSLGHVNNVVYVDYLQEARVDMLRVQAFLVTQVQYLASSERIAPVQRDTGGDAEIGEAAPAHPEGERVLE